MPENTKRKRITSNNDVITTGQQKEFNLFSSTSWTNLKVPTIVHQPITKSYRQEGKDDDDVDISYYNLFDSMMAVEGSFEEQQPSTSEIKTFTSTSATNGQEGDDDKANARSSSNGAAGGLFNGSRHSSTPSISSTSSSGSEKRKSYTSQITRDRKSGAFTFRNNSEYELMIHVQQGLDSFNFETLTDVESADVILKSVDSYCFGKQWMFHIGQEKGEYIKEFLQKCIKAKKQQNDDHQEEEPLVIVELGTYCGYSAILLAKTVRQYAPNLNKFHIYSTEVDPKVVQVANNMILMAKLQKYVTVILFEPSIHKLSVTLQKHIMKAAAAGPSSSSSKKKKIDFLLLDHAKNQYLEDLIHLENSGLVQSGSYVAADNVIYNNLVDYQHHLKQYAQLGVVETKLAKMKLEYSDDIRDGIELTTYLKDPKSY